MRRWCVATVVVLFAGALAVGANAPSLYNTYEYAKETKRAQSELTPLAQVADDEPGARPTGGMPYDQIVGWSYGGAESFSLLVPNIKGGATARPEGGSMVHMGLDRLPGAAKYQGQPVGELMAYMPQYFNDSEGTNGPVYVGALMCALFLLGCLVVRGPLKWALLGVSVLALLLALGRNFAWLTDLMIYHFPMYNKFRAVESILVIVEFTVPVLGVLGLTRLLNMPRDEARTMMRPLAIAFGVPVVLCLAAAVARVSSATPSPSRTEPHRRPYSSSLRPWDSNTAPLRPRFRRPPTATRCPIPQWCRPSRSCATEWSRTMLCARLSSLPSVSVSSP